MKAARGLTDRQKQRIRKLVDEEFTIPEIASRMQIRQSRIYRFCQKEQLDVRLSYNQLPEDDEVIIAMVSKLRSVEAVADKFKVTRQAVYSRIARYKENA